MSRPYSIPILTLPSLLCAIWKTCSSLSFLNKEEGRLSMRFPLRFSTVKWTRQSSPSIFDMQLLANWSSLSCVRLSSLSIFSIMWLFKLRCQSILILSRFSIYCNVNKSSYYISLRVQLSLLALRPLGMFHQKGCLYLIDRNCILMT